MKYRKNYCINIFNNEYIYIYSFCSFVTATMAILFDTYESVSIWSTGSVNYPLDMVFNINQVQKRELVNTCKTANKWDGRTTKH
jgi:hypothetical protein